VRLLIVEDDASTRRFLQRSLTGEQFHVEAAGDGESAIARAVAGRFDAIVLDVMLADHDGFAVCRCLRTRGVDAPILLLTGDHGVADRIRGLDAGADDYLGKPFVFEELLARLRAITRRGCSRQLAGVLSSGPLEIDQQTRQAAVDGSPVALSDTEFRLLRYLLLRAGRPVSRIDLAQHVWDDGESPASHVIDVYVGCLRRRLGAAGALIRTVPGVGYSITGERRAV